ncbi:TPA_exp: Uncharacterized protein A8136_5454 [Trichophyton benhamiae CBS 112371]|uniref:Uncharacterized protein n=1 Tax=Arthroderma benhamiae (strain ATCC MYA-4681 / CBS 112371) TaxID=663331 RepID=D4B5B6_ARTBC|nr:uncharacterized protein ARB_03656 [Trichophyton benhamiae CBS 112371]EFE29449.1 hypothetical protein ARB_03656 [Trichophyton benhamiae CBS 112371]DAA72728.1 TPA_exp: Uncharacterized protein A8136_5454 [Trichophyton benhamiae CBS 112371]
MRPHAYNGPKTGPGEAGNSRRGAEPYADPHGHASPAVRRLQRVLRLSRPYILAAEQAERADPDEPNDEAAQREQAERALAEQETAEQGLVEQVQAVQTGQDGQQVDQAMQQLVEERHAISPEEEQETAVTAEEGQAEQPETQPTAPQVKDEAREPDQAGRSRRGQGRRRGRGRRAAPGSGSGRGQATEQRPEVIRTRERGVGRGRAAEQRPEANRARGTGRRRPRGRERGQGQGQGAIPELEQRLEQQPLGELNSEPLLVQPVVNPEPQFEARVETEAQVEIEARVVTPGQPQARVGEQLVREQVIQQELTDILAQQESQPELPPVPAPVPAPAETIPPQLMHLRHLPAPEVRPHMAHSQRVQALLQEQQQDLLRQQHARQAREEELAQWPEIASHRESLQRVQVTLRTRELQMIGEAREGQPEPEIRRVELAVHQGQVREVEELQEQMQSMQAQQQQLLEMRLQEAMNEPLEDPQQRQHQEEDAGQPNFRETSVEGQQQLQPQLPESNRIESIPQPIYDGMQPNGMAFPRTEFARRSVSLLVIPLDVRQELIQASPEDEDGEYDGGVALGQENMDWNGNDNRYGNGDGNGNGYVNGNTNGYVNGNGNDYGNGYGNGYSNGYVNGNANGDANGSEEMSETEVRFAIEEAVQLRTWAQLEEIQQDHTRREFQGSNGMDAAAASRLLSRWSGRRVYPTTQFPAVPEYHPHYRNEGFYPVSRGVSEALSDVRAARMEEGEHIVDEEEFEYFNLGSGRSEQLVHDGPAGDQDELTEDNLQVGMVLIAQTTPAEYEHWKTRRDTQATWAEVKLGEEMARLRVRMERWEATVRWMWQMAEVWERDGGFEKIVEFDADVLEAMRLDGEVSDDDELVGFMDDLDVSVTTTDYDAVYC